MSAGTLPRTRRSRIHRRIRQIWAACGVLAMLFLAWSFMAHGVDRSLLETDARVRVTDHGSHIEFAPLHDGPPVNLLFFPGGMVQTEAYVPMAHAIARAGFRVILIRLPFLGRHAPGERYRREALKRALDAIRETGAAVRWAVAGHSFGGVMASQLAAESPDAVASLILVATTHPRDVDLSSTRLPVMKILGTNDGIASPARARANASRLPPDTRWIEIDGANHEQFAYYGPHLGGGRATISRDVQQARLVALIVEELQRIAQARLAHQRTGPSSAGAGSFTAASTADPVQTTP